MMEINTYSHFFQNKDGNTLSLTNPLEFRSFGNQLYFFPIFD